MKKILRAILFGPFIFVIMFLNPVWYITVFIDWLTTDKSLNELWVSWNLFKINEDICSS